MPSPDSPTRPPEKPSRTTAGRRWERSHRRRRVLVGATTAVALTVAVGAIPVLSPPSAYGDVLTEACKEIWTEVEGGLDDWPEEGEAGVETSGEDYAYDDELAGKMLDELESLHNGQYDEYLAEWEFARPGTMDHARWAYGVMLEDEVKRPRFDAVPF